MTFDRIHRNTLFSILLFLFFCAILLSINWDTDFAGAGLLFITDFVALLIGLFFVVIKLFKVSIRKTNFIYNYAGTLNIILGCINLIFLISIGLSKLVLFWTLTHLICGIFILHDIFKKDSSLLS